MRIRIICVLAVLVLAPSAQAVTAPELVRHVAGRNGDIACAEIQANGLTWISEARVRLAPWVCEAVAGQNNRLGEALNTIAHEAAHLRGIRDEAVASCWGLLWTADLARSFFAVEFFTSRSESLMRQSRFLHEQLPADFKSVCA